MKPKIILDTSVIVAALFGSKSTRILRAWRKDKILLCYSQPILDEYKMILKRIPPIRKKAKKFLNLLQKHSSSEFVKKVSPVDVHIEDPDDRKFLECAAEINADYLLSLDEHLLQVGKIVNTEIFRPSKFLKKVNLDPVIKGK